MITLSDRGVRVRLRSFRCGDISTVGGRATFPMTTSNYAVVLRPIRYWMKEMKKTLGLSVLAAISSTALFADETIFLEEIVVNSTFSPIENWKTGSSIVSIDSTKIDTFGSTNLINLLNATPGMSMTQYGGMGQLGFFQMRGMKSNYVSVYKDGINVTDPSSTKVAFNDFGALSTAGLSSIEILKGTQSPVHGSSAVAGVINMTTIDTKNAESGFSSAIEAGLGSHNTAMGKYALTHAGNGFSFGFNTIKFKTDGISSATTTSKDYSTGKNNYEKDKFESFSTSFRGEVDLTDRWTIGSNFFMEESIADIDEYYSGNAGSGFIDGTPDDYTKNKKSGARFYTSFAIENWSHNISLTAFDIRRQTVNSSFADGSAPVNDVFKGHRETVQYVASGKISDQIKISFGADRKKETSETAALNNVKRSSTIDGIFSEVQYSPFPKLSIVGNARFDRNSNFGNLEAYRLSAAYKLTENTVIRGQLSDGYRAPSIDELYGTYNEYGYTYLPNVSLTPEKQETIELTLDQNLLGGGLLSITTFKTDFKDLIGLDWITQTTAINKNLGRAKARGTEVNLKIPLSDKTDLEMAFSGTSSENISGSPSAGKQTSINLYHRFSKKLTSSLQFMSLSDRPAAWSAPREDYQLLNASAQYSINDNLVAYGKIENIEDIIYETEPGFSSPGRTIFMGIRASF